LFIKFFWHSLFTKTIASNGNLFYFNSNRTIRSWVNMIAFTIGIIVLSSYNANAQLQGLAPVKTPQGGFAVDGDAFANTPLLYPKSGDWFRDSISYPGPGGGLFNSNGTVVDPTMTFFLQDPWNGTDPTTFITSNKINDDPNSYLWGPGTSPNKNEIQNAGVHFTYGDPVLGGNAKDVWCLFAADRQVTNGSSYIDFEFLQKSLTMLGATSGGFVSAGTQGGRTVGDILVTIEFVNGGGAARVEVQRWQAVGTTFQYVIITTPLTGIIYITQNTVSTIVPFDVYGSGIPGTYQVNQWAEGAINLTAILGEGVNPCQLLSTVFIRTRTSGSSHSSELKDFPVAPIQINLKLNPDDLVLTGSSICANDANAGTVTSTTSKSGINYQLYNSLNAPVQSAKIGSGSGLTWTGLTTGIYHVISMDPSLTVICPGGSNSATVNIFANPTASDSHTNVLCNGGNTGAIIVTFIADSISFNGSAFSFQTSPKTYNDLTAGTYHWIVKDQNGCINSDSEIVTEPTELLASSSHSNVLCNGGSTGSVTITFSGGTPADSISFNGGVYELQTSPKTYTDLAAGTYNWIIKDQNGCNKNGTEIVTEPTELLASSSHTNVLCNGGSTGSVTITFSGGTPADSISFNGGVYALQTSPKTYTDLAAGTFNWIVKDQNGCTKNGTEIVTEPTELLASSSHTNVLCNGGSTGSVSISFSGGTPADSVSFNGGVYALQTSPKTYSDLAAGTYNWIVKDQNGCTKNGSEIVAEPTELLASSVHTNVLCNGANNGSIDLTVTGGTPPFTYLWSNLATTQDLDSLMPGSYSVIITDSNGCTTSNRLSITEPPPLQLLFTKINPTCMSGLDGSVSANVTGGTPNYSYLWNDSLASTTASIVGLGSGTYTVTITDANGCIISGNATIAALPCTGFVTFTQGGYGSTPHGNNPGTYVANHFLAAFPSGLTVGYGTNLLRLTSVASVRNFLPSGTAPASLPSGTMTNPGGSYSNVLAGQVVALTLNVGFDEYYPSFAPSISNLGLLNIGKGTFIGKTVAELLFIANQALGGVSTGYTLSEINDGVTMVNENFDNGTTNNGNLFCSCNSMPSKTGEVFSGIDGKDRQESFSESNFLCYPNPSSTEVNISFMIAYNSDVKIEIYNVAGELVSTVFSNQVVANQKYNLKQNCETMRSGIYFFKLITKNENLVKRLMIVK